MQEIIRSARTADRGAPIRDPLLYFQSAVTQTPVVDSRVDEWSEERDTRTTDSWSVEERRFYGV